VKSVPLLKDSRKIISRNVSRPRARSRGEGDGGTCRMLDTIHILFTSGYLNVKFHSCEATRRCHSYGQEDCNIHSRRKPQTSFVKANDVGHRVHKKLGDHDCAVKIFHGKKLWKNLFRCCFIQHDDVSNLSFALTSV
jgi:hypothetical protein